jgi:septation ring formation regulator EzrA
VKHDASLGRRQREALKVELESLLKQIESKSNQIYSLYDVLEGQAEAGQEMTQQELEIELKRMSYDPMDIDDELPWEGIEESVY